MSRSRTWSRPSSGARDGTLDRIVVLRSNHDVPISRSENMSRIRGKDTGPEVRLRLALVAAGVVIDTTNRAPVGRPDIVFGERRLAVFVDGCQWHGCPDHYASPRTRADFWRRKLTSSVERDRRQTFALEAAGWTVLRIWEHEVVVDVAAAAARVVAALDGPPPQRSDWRVKQVDVVDGEQRIERRILADLRNDALEREVIGRRVTAKARPPSTRRGGGPG